MKVVGIIPARYHSTRLEGKPLVDILGKPIAQHLPTGPGSDMLTILMGRSQEIFSRHEVNQVRRDLGENPATQIWLWGQGKKPSLPKFEERFGVRGAAISAVDLIRGLARLVGWDVVNVPGATGFLDTNYAGKAAAAIEALKDHDLVCVHVEGVDEAGHQGDFKGKILGLEHGGARAHAVRTAAGAPARRLGRVAHPGVARPPHPLPAADPHGRAGAVRPGRQRHHLGAQTGIHRGVSRFQRPAHRHRRGAYGVFPQGKVSREAGQTMFTTG